MTIDAMGMQTAIVEKIREKKADYVIGVKDNQRKLAADMTTLLNERFHCVIAGFVTDLHVTTEKARVGVEQRDVRVIEIPKDSPHRLFGKDIRTLAVVLTRTKDKASRPSKLDYIQADPPPRPRYCRS